MGSMEKIISIQKIIHITLNREVWDNPDEQFADWDQQPPDSLFLSQNFSPLDQSSLEEGLQAQHEEIWFRDSLDWARWQTKKTKI